MQNVFSSHWLFALFCLAGAVAVLRLILRERITLQMSLLYLLFLVSMGVAALFPAVDVRLAHWMGFELLSNWFFAVSIAALLFLHLVALVSLSRVELRSIALAQQLAILEERLARQK